MIRILGVDLFLIDEYFEKQLRQFLSRHILQPLNESEFCVTFLRGNKVPLVGQKLRHFWSILSQ